MSAISEDEVVRRKLLIEGDGGNDDKRLTNLLKYFLDWCNEPTDEVKKDSCNSKYQRLLTTLAQCEYQAEKTELMRLMNIKEQDRYEKAYCDIGKRIESAGVEIEECKQELVKARKVRRNKQEYDAWAKKAMEHPDREKTQCELNKVQENLSQLNETRRDIESKLEHRRKQFAFLMVALNDLEATLQEDLVKEEPTDDQDMSVD